MNSQLNLYNLNTMIFLICIGTRYLHDRETQINRPPNNKKELFYGVCMRGGGFTIIQG